MSTILYGSRAEEPPDPPTFSCRAEGCSYEVWDDGAFCPIHDDAENLIATLIAEQADAFDRGNTGHGAWLAGEIADQLTETAA